MGGWVGLGWGKKSVHCVQIFPPKSPSLAGAFLLYNFVKTHFLQSSFEQTFETRADSPPLPAGADVHATSIFFNAMNKGATKKPHSKTEAQTWLCIKQPRLERLKQRRNEKKKIKKRLHEKILSTPWNPSVCVCEGGGSPVADAAMFVWVLPLSIDDTPFYFTAAIYTRLVPALAETAAAATIGIRRLFDEKCLKPCVTPCFWWIQPFHYLKKKCSFSLCPLKWLLCCFVDINKCDWQYLAFEINMLTLLKVEDMHLVSFLDKHTFIFANPI